MCNLFNGEQGYTLLCDEYTGYCVFLYGSTTIESFFILEDETVVQSPSIFLSSRCGLIDYCHGILFTALVDGSLLFWEKDSENQWKRIGSELYNTYRITDICCSNFPYVVISIRISIPPFLATWEGNIYLKLFTPHPTQPSLKLIHSVESHSELKPGGWDWVEWWV